MRPIPKRLLIHSAELSTPQNCDIWQKITYSDPVNLQHVRLEPCSKIVLDANNTQRQQTATLFFDAVNSSPSGTEFTAGQRVQALGQTYTVLTIEQLYDDRKLHHLEVGLG
ncbi:MAG: minor capsid protein [Clostridia bacterium]|nr:minor capsid protein [Clostridia bacterium]